MNIVYKKEIIEKVLQSLNLLSISPGVANAVRLTEIYNILNSQAKPLPDDSGKVEE